MRKKIVVITLAVILSFSFSYWVFSQNERKKKNDLYRQLEIFSDALSLIQEEYVDEPKSQDLIYGALKGMLSSLDPYSEFLDAERFNELKVETEGKFGGIGIEIVLKDNLLTVVTPIEDTPAWKAGVKAGDRIVKINGELTRNIAISDAVKKLRGKPGTEVVLTLFREKHPKLIEAKIVRDTIKIKDIKDARILEDNIGYVRLVEFRENTSRDLDTALAQLNKSGMDSMILDLRNNPGGLLDVAVSVTDKFIPADKVIVSTKGRISMQNMEFKSYSRGSKYLDIPLVILVNEGSASGSEIVAGALQDYRRAVIIGNKTFGKGSVQSVLPLSDGSALKLTTSKYFTPLGRLIHNDGINPDIAVEAGKVDIVADDSDETEDIFDELKEKEVKTEKEESLKEGLDYKKDNQIIRAVDVIKGIKIYKELSKAAGLSKS